MSTIVTRDGSIGRGFPAKAWGRTGALPAGVLAGALFGALIGGIGGRIVMRLNFLIDRETDGAKTDFGTIGEITIGGSFTLLVLSTIAGIIGGVLYVGLRRWLPWSRAGRGVFFGLLMLYGPGSIAISEIDLSIVEPALPIYAMFAALVLLYGVSVALLVDRLHAPPVARPGPRVELAGRVLQGLLALGICFMAVAVTLNVYDKAGSCLSADNDGGCAARPAD